MERSDDGERLLLEYGMDPDGIVEAGCGEWSLWRAQTLRELRAELRAWLRPTVH